MEMREYPYGSCCLLSGSFLKLLAVVSMSCDHAAVLLLSHVDSFTDPLLAIGNHVVSWYFLMRSAGRLAFPLFAFLVVEGFLHTRSLRRYVLHLLVFALLSVVPWHLARYGCCFTLHSQNVLFTLLLGVLAMGAQRLFSGRMLAVVLLTLMAIASALHTDYGACGVGFILALHALRRQPAVQAAVCVAILPLMRWAAALAFIPINFYNGRRGFIRGTLAKYAFYLYYPLHLLVLYLLRCAMTG